MKSSAVAMIVDHTLYMYGTGYRPLSGIDVVNISIYLFTVSNWSLLLIPVGVFADDRSVLWLNDTSQWSYRESV